jgi:hypothetical protein
MKIHGYGPSGWELVVFVLIAILTLPIWLPAWILWKLYKKIRGNK